MGNIPEFITRQLPSAVTGTLGVDPTAGTLGAGIASFGADIANTEFQRMAEVKETVDTIKSQKMVREFEREILEKGKDIQEQFSDNPEQGLKEYNKQVEKMFSDRLSGIDDTFVKRMVAQSGTGIVRSGSNQMFTWLLNQQVVNGAADFNSIINMASNDLVQKPTPEMFNKKINELKSLTVKAKNFWGEKTPQKIRESLESLARGYLFGLENENPLEGKERLEKGEFNSFFPPDELRKLKNDMDNAVKGWQDKIEFDTQVKALGTIVSAGEAYNEGNLNSIFVNKIMIEFENSLEGKQLNAVEQKLVDTQRKSFEALAKIARKKPAFTSIDQIQNENKLLDEYRRLEIDADKLTSTKTVGRVSEFYANLNQAAANGEIGEEFYRTYSRNISTVYDDAAKSATVDGWFWSKALQEPENKTHSLIDSWINDFGFSEEQTPLIRVELSTKVWKRLQELEQLGTPKSEAIIEKVFNQERLKFLKSLKPERFSNISEKGTEIVEKDGGLVYTIFPDGRIVLGENK